jgi:hypothetical protein
MGNWRPSDAVDEVGGTARHGRPAMTRALLGLIGCLGEWPGLLAGDAYSCSANAVTNGSLNKTRLAGLLLCGWNGEKKKVVWFRLKWAKRKSTKQTWKTDDGSGAQAACWLPWWQRTGCSATVARARGAWMCATLCPSQHHNDRFDIIVSGPNPDQDSVIHGLTYAWNYSTSF